MKDLRKDNTEEEECYKYKFVFKSGNNKKIIKFITDTNNKKIVRQIAREELIDEVGSGNITNFSTDKIHISLAFKKWRNGNELADQIKRLQHVSQTRFIGVFQNGYSSPKVIVEPAASASVQSVEQEIDNYHSGLRTERENRKVIVFPAASFD